MEIFARDYGITSGCDVTEQLSSLLKSLRGKRDISLVFDEGEYFIDSNSCDAETLHITNSTAEDEWSATETPYLCRIALNLKNLENFTLCGNGATFVIDGKATNVVVEDCKNVSLQDLSIKVVNPDMHEFIVEAVNAFSVDFRLDGESRYEKTDKGFTFTGKGFSTAFTDRRTTAFWNAYVSVADTDTIRRVPHPFRGAYKITELSPYLFRASYILRLKCAVGDKFCLFDNRRKNAGIFVNRSENVTLFKVTQRFNYGLAYVAQNSETLTLDTVTFAPDEGERLMASVADFIQICMCRGQVTVKNSLFEGAGDDCLNVHGVHFKITSISGNKLTVRFCHAQTFGYNPLRVGDAIEYVNPKTLLSDGVAKIVESESISPYEIRLTVDNTEGALIGAVIEDVTACPDLRFAKNVLNRIITRGILITTRGKVVVENNFFKSTYMHGILISDDARNWFESGRVTDVAICGNTFLKCPELTVCVKPENLGTAVVHKGIVIADNVIKSDGGGYYFKCAEVTLKDGNARSIKSINSAVNIK